MTTLKVIIVDDHEVVRLGLMTLLDDLDWIEVVGEAGTAIEALQAVEQFHPDVVILDINLPGESGIYACQEITNKHPDTKVIILTAYLDDEIIMQALKAGASGYVLKKVGSHTIVDALDAVRQGNSLLDPIVTQKIISLVRDDEKEKQFTAFKDLTKREKEVLFWISTGKSNSQIADILFITQKTTGHHVSNILQKLKVKNRVEAAIFASKNDIDKLHQS
ncbi:MAG: response regulator transcription factor, partial [Chloroflexota bacterium]